MTGRIRCHGPTDYTGKCPTCDRKPLDLPVFEHKEEPMKVGSEEWFNFMHELHGDMLKMDGYDDCLVGVCHRAGQEVVFIYDWYKVIAKLMKDGMTEEEAIEFHEFNQAGAWLGERTPAFLTC